MRAKGNVLRAGHRVGLLVSGLRAKVRSKSVSSKTHCLLACLPFCLLAY